MRKINWNKPYVTGYGPPPNFLEQDGIRFLANGDEYIDPDAPPIVETSQGPPKATPVEELPPVSAWEEYTSKEENVSRETFEPEVEESEPSIEDYKAKTRPEIMAALDVLGVKYNKNMRKTPLIDLLENAMRATQ